LDAIYLVVRNQFATLRSVSEILNLGFGERPICARGSETT
jgi:hypothetical protein